MADEKIKTVNQEKQVGISALWFLWGLVLSLTTICSVVFFGLLIVSVLLNVYLSWQLSDVEIIISRGQPEPVPVQVEQPAPPPAPAVLVVTATPEAVAPTPTPEVIVTKPPAEVAEVSPLEDQLATLSAMATSLPTPQPTNTPIPPPTESPLEVQFGTLAAIATEAAAQSVNTPNAPLDIVLTSPPVVIAATDPASGLKVDSQAVASAGGAQDFAPPESESYTSSNTYTLIPLEGGRDPRPAEEHGDLNLILREPEPIEADLSLMDTAPGVDPDAISMSDIFEPNIVAAYTVHNWDWACNCPGEVLDQVAMIGIETTPGEPVFIPQKAQDIYGGDVMAVVLYASEDSLTFAYARDGTVAQGYAVHYHGLRTDPNLLALYQESQGNELPGLTNDTPVGIATDELKVAIRDKGTFMEPRSTGDWWD